MKKILFLTATFLLSACSLFVQAQNKIKEGKLKFEMSYPDSGAAGDLMAMMPKEMVIYFKNGDTRTEAPMGIGNMVMISMAKSGDRYTLMDMMGSKMAMKMTQDDMKEFRDSMKMEKPEIKITNETKMIAFYKCNKIIVTQLFKGEKKSFEMWVTKDIDNIDMGDYKVEGVDGFLMEFTASEKGMTVHMVCTSVEKYEVPESMFKVPADYKVMNMADMKNGIDMH